MSTSSAIAAARARHPLASRRTHVDANTGRTIRQITEGERGSSISYFRMPRNFKDGRLLVDGANGLMILDPDSGDLSDVNMPKGSHVMKFHEATETVWFFDADHQLCRMRIPGGDPEVVYKITGELPGDISDVTIDGKTAILREHREDLTNHPVPTTKDVDVLWRYFNRPRSGGLHTLDLATGVTNQIYQIDAITPSHVDCSPRDPAVVRFCLDMYDAWGQRTWAINVDGSDLRKIRPQAYNELITHEFWWANPDYIGFTYQDRRNDSTVEALPWAEYSPARTQLGIADLSGREVYLSDPLNSYHTHLYMSPDGSLVTGEGTHDHSFVDVARFDMRDTKVDFQSLATVRTTYVPFRGQYVNCCASANNRWLLYNDTSDNGTLQVFAVEIDL